MSVRDIIPWRRKESTKALATRDYYGETFARLHEDVNALFKSLFADVGLESWSPRGMPFSPDVDVVETEGAITVTAELPGLEEKDIEVSLDEDGLILKGDKRAESEETVDGYRRIERSYGTFFRRIPLPDNIHPDRIEASFAKGVLKITVPKAETEKGSPVKVTVN